MGKLFGLMKVAAVLAAGALALPAAAAPDRAGNDLAQLLAQLGGNTGGQVAQTWSAASQSYNFVRAGGSALLMQDSAAQPAEDRARFFLSIYGALVGIKDQATELSYLRTDKDQTGTLHARFTQRYNGLPVFGGDTVVHMNDRGILAVSGALVPDLAGLSIVPALTLTQARSAALARVAELHPKAVLSVTETALTIYRSGLLDGGRELRNDLAWTITVRGRGINEQLWVNAQNGAILNRIDRVERAQYRKIYSPSYDPASEDNNLVRQEGDPPIVAVPIPLIGDPIDNLYDFAGGVYDFYNKTFGRDSYDAKGAKMHSVYLVNDQCPNAYWDGTATNYCPGFDADDVVSHEWSHAVTQYIDNLIYQYQPGALNESNSDVFGETIDLTNNRDGIGGSVNDKPYPDGERWLIAEDIGTGTVDPVPIVGKFVEQILMRDMWDPDRLGSPGKVSSTNYVCSPTSDNGGVHTNSGVPNHAYAILADGKDYNGVKTTGIGLVKAANIYYKSKFYQGPSSNFVAHADGLEAACQDLIGQPIKNFDGTPFVSTISAADCQQVVNSNTAVEMRKTPTQCSFQPILKPETQTPALCGSGLFVTPALKENWEGGVLPNGWTLTSTGTGDAWPKLNWTVTSQIPAGHSGFAVYAKNDKGGTCKSGGDISGSFTLNSPEVTLTNNASKLAFTHYVATESGFDGGNLSVSVNGGAYALVPAASYSFNPPNATLNSAPPPIPVSIPDPVGLFGNNSNPMAGQSAWSGTDGGELHGSWGTTLVDLSALAKKGDKIKLRWTFGNDCASGVDGWYVDTTQVYSCETTAPVNHAPLASLVATTPTSGHAPLTVSFDASSSSDPDHDAITQYRFDFGDGSAVQSGAAPTATHTYTAVRDYTATVTVQDEHGLDSAQQGSVPVHVTADTPNQAPTLSGFTATPTTADTGVSISFNATASDADGDAITYIYNFGDGGGDSPQSAATVTHAYAAAGSYTASVKVKDATHPESAPLTATVTITTPGGGTPTNHAPQVNSFDATPSSGEASSHTPLNVTFTAAATDADGDSFKYLFDFGDGTGMQSLSGTVSHAYTAANVYNATVQALDSHNQAGNVMSKTITVSAIPNHTPVAALTVTPDSGNTPLKVTIDASGSTDADGDALTYSFDFGDQQKLLNSNAAQVEHIYTVAGSYTVKVDVQDSHNAKSSKSVTLQVSAAPAGSKSSGSGALNLALLLPLLGFAVLRRRKTR